FITWKRNDIKNTFTKKATRSPSIDSEKPSIELDRVIKQMRPKPLIEYIKINSQVKKEIYEEFEELEKISPCYHQSNYNPDLVVYDRYKNIPARGPWEQTAVYLTGVHRFHDYINANEIISYDKTRKYIACQGPLENTCEDFWDMIIQYKAPKIPKCHSYFPKRKGEQMKFDNIVVKVNHIESYPHTSLEIRHLSIRQYEVKHAVIHYHYTGWPDFNVVEARKLLALIDKVNTHESSLSSVCHRTINGSFSTPIVVHCSAGVGRTGTYITVDTITRLLDRSNAELATYELDVMAIVYHLRQQRVKMVQTKEQYLLIYRCVEAYLKQTDRLDVVAPDLSNPYENLQNFSQISASHHYMNSSTGRNVTKNRSNIDPLSYYIDTENNRPILERSSTITSQVSGHSHLSHPQTRRPTNDPSPYDFYPREENVNTNHHTRPQIPPRRSISTPTGLRIHQRNT
ncbi:unnamed protein product, partial [Rotaria sp. Silwood1]